MKPCAALLLAAGLLGAAAPAFLAQEDSVTDPTSPEDPAAAQDPSDSEEGAPAGEAPVTLITTLEDVERARAGAGRAYQEFLRVPDMNAGLYVLPAGARDGQKPHAQDEIYHVVAGRAVFVAEGERTPIGPGSLVHVRAGVEHRFEDITADLTVLVVFAGH